MVLERQANPDTARQAERLLEAAGVIIEPVTLRQGLLARQAFYDFGRGRHPARLNFGECFAYALAEGLDEPLLFKGDDFKEADVRRFH
jgi:ribonuclease VapC